MNILIKNTVRYSSSWTIALGLFCSIIHRYDSKLITPLSALKPIKLGVSFSPAGLLTPYHLGASEQLRKYKVITKNTSLSGSSGGALAAITSGLDIDTKLSMKGSNYVAQRCRDEGPRGTLYSALEQVLLDILPNNAHDLLNKRPTPCILAYTELIPIFQPQFIQNFSDKNDIIEVLLASCNIPFYFNGNKLTTSVRGTSAVDGFFTTSFNRFGCPPTGATEREILVTPYSASLIGLNPQLNQPIDSSCKYDIISPDLLLSDSNKKYWPFSFIDIITMSFGAPNSKLNPTKPISDEELKEIYELLFLAGQESVKIWYSKSDL